RLYAEPLRQAPLAGRAGEHWVVWIDGRVFLDGVATDTRLDAPVGTVAGEGLLAVAGAEALLLLTPDGQVVDHVGAASLPGRIERIGRGASGEIVLATADGLFATRDGLDFTPMDERGDVRWSDPPASAPPAALAPALAAYRGEGVALHRVVADLHSGRFMGPVGPYVMDAAALGLILLAGSGFILWRRRR
ncbi:MAG: PepSY domain-containing protein, partial [Rhodothalassiaceae bacterium]